MFLKGLEHCFHLFMDLLQDKNIYSRAVQDSSRAVQDSITTDARILQLTKNSKIFGGM